jgi:hypothetical protein
VLAVAAIERRWSAFSAPGLGRQRPLSTGPQTCRRLHANDIVEVHRPQASPEGIVDAAAGIGQNHARRCARFLGLQDVIEGDLRFFLNVTASGTPALVRRTRS